MAGADERRILEVKEANNERCGSEWGCAVFARTVPKQEEKTGKKRLTFSPNHVIYVVVILSKEAVRLNRLQRAKDVAVIIFAAVLLAFGYHMFIFPNQFAPAGVPGIATMIQYLFGFKVAYLTVLVNVPLLIAAYFIVGKEFAIHSAVYAAIFSLTLLLLDEIDLSAIAYHTENGTSTVLAPIAGGVVSGYSYTLVMKRNGCTGGTDLVGALVHHYNPERNMLWIIFAINALVAAASYFVYDFRIEPVILCLIYCFISSKVCDLTLKGFKEAVKFEVVTDQPDALADAIMQQTHHGVTEISAIGGFTHSNKTLLICIVNKHQIVQFQQVIQRFPGSFAYLSGVKETMGNFRKIK